MRLDDAHYSKQIDSIERYLGSTFENMLSCAPGQESAGENSVTGLSFEQRSCPLHEQQQASNLAPNRQRAGMDGNR
jgi:hypothetical protein